MSYDENKTSIDVNIIQHEFYKNNDFRDYIIPDAIKSFRQLQIGDNLTKLKVTHNDVGSQFQANRGIMRVNQNHIPVFRDIAENLDDGDYHSSFRLIHMFE